MVNDLGQGPGRHDAAPSPERAGRSHMAWSEAVIPPLQDPAEPGKRPSRLKARYRPCRQVWGCPAGVTLSFRRFAPANSPWGGSRREPYAMPLPERERVGVRDRPRRRSPRNPDAGSAAGGSPSSGRLRRLDLSLSADVTLPRLRAASCQSNAFICKGQDLVSHARCASGVPARPGAELEPLYSHSPSLDRGGCRLRGPAAAQPAGRLARHAP